MEACLRAQRNVLIEGPVGVGKTHLALTVAKAMKRPVFRVDGDSRYSEQKLVGWFDPPTVIKKGFTAEAFMPGPLVEAMQKGGVLFINELNRLPEGVQNVLLPAIDERMILVPRLGEIQAVGGFLVIATQNPKEFVATSHLSEAILDRFELVMLDYQTEQEEVKIVEDRLCLPRSLKPEQSLLALASVRLVRLTRSHPQVKRGASLRAALSLAEIAGVLIAEALAQESVPPQEQWKHWKAAFFTAAQMALPTRIEIERDMDAGDSYQAQMESLIEAWVNETLEGLGPSGESSLEEEEESQSGVKKKT